MLLIVCVSGLAIGTFHGLIITKIGVPSFVVTLAGLLAWNGVVLLLIGSKGTVILQNDFVIGVANDFLPDGTAWILMIVVSALYALVQLASLRSRKSAGLATDPPVIVALRIGALTLALAVVVALCNQDRGLPYVALVVGALFVFWTFVLNRTKFGRHIYAVGGNAEAARRAGINVDNVDRLLRARVDHGRDRRASSSPRACGRSTRTRAAARRCCTRSPRRSSAARRCSAGAAR